MAIKPWQVLERVITYEDQWLKVRSDRCSDSFGREISPFHVLEYPNWVNVVALTARLEIVLVREYRHGAGRVLLGLPAGAMDATDLTPEAAARRELREETGFSGGKFTEIGCVYANPANQNNLVSSFLALEVSVETPQNLDANEDIEVVIEDFGRFLGRVRRRELRLGATHCTALLLSASHLLADRAPGTSELRKTIASEFTGESEAGN